MCIKIFLSWSSAPFARNFYESFMELYANFTRADFQWWGVGQDEVLVPAQFRIVVQGA